MDAKIVAKAISNMGLNFVQAKDAKNTLDEYYEILKEYDLKTIGGKVHTLLFGRK